MWVYWSFTHCCWNYKPMLFPGKTVLYYSNLHAQSYDLASLFLDYIMKSNLHIGPKEPVSKMLTVMVAYSLCKWQLLEWGR